MTKHSFDEIIALITQTTRFIFMNNITADKTIGAFEARRKFGSMLREIEVKGDSFVVEKHGEAVAAIVPIDVYHQWKKIREAFFQKIRNTANSINLSSDEAERIANEAVTAARAVS